MTKIFFFVLLLATTVNGQLTRTTAGNIRQDKANKTNVRVELENVEKIQLPPILTLEGLIARLEKQLAGIDRPLLIERRWELVEQFYRYKDGRRELVFLDSVRTNLKQVYLLNRKLAEKGEISDQAALASHNTYLRAELEYLSAERTIRDAILAIVRLANLELTLDTEN